MYAMNDIFENKRVGVAFQIVLGSLVDQWVSVVLLGLAKPSVRSFRRNDVCFVL